MTIPLESSASSIDWSYTFQKAGVYLVHANVTTIDDQHLGTTSVINIQENVGDILIRGPMLSKFTW